MPSESKKPKMYLGVTVQMLLNLGPRKDCTYIIGIVIASVHWCQGTLNQTTCNAGCITYCALLNCQSTWICHTLNMHQSKCWLNVWQNLHFFALRKRLGENRIRLQLQDRTILRGLDTFSYQLGSEQASMVFCKLRYALFVLPCANIVKTPT